MAEDAPEDRLRRHEEMLEGLAKVWMRQSELNERMDACMTDQRVMNQRLESYVARQDVFTDRLKTVLGELRDFNRQQIILNARVETTLADIKTLLQRLIGGSGNGREA
jgi:hypothetical protein